MFPGRAFEIPWYNIIIRISKYFRNMSSSGNEQWLYWHPDDEGYHEEGWMPVRTVKVSQGTTPAHSEWAMINLPTHTGDGNEWAWKDLVEVPEDLEPGEYVLSFRWDCLHSPQVWNSCSNIVIV